ncbi:MAG: Protein of unknown function (DUF1553)/Protein of unknown function (DUF1549)/Planctomycete [Planctomycetaceae bacterium]|nr:Protein of unknown function (DUF1553)/Protein of unknown function (DUF1549)/Planctomycete [Planctomycetaceae bacterium]
MLSWRVACSQIALIVACGFPITGAAAEPAPVDFNRTIRPILSSICFKCHGPDHEERKGGLRLDLRDSALQKLESGNRAIVPGKPDESELVRRILSTDDSERMPPPKSQHQLTEKDKTALRQWVAQGAEYRQHWSFQKVQRPALPPVEETAWAKNAIDRFVLARLESAGLKPSPEADRTTLIRRVTLDLTGLPPTLQEVDEFLADQRPDAYERVVDRLLSTSQYAERMTVDWLDAARFADTNGYHIDNGRDMSRWREWVIAAFADNKPYDQFTVEQLAGDLLPNATLSQKIASGFNRNHMINFEGGAIPEEYHMAYIVDRVNTTGTVFMGLTVGCAQCHDHKYDALTQKEYYQLYAFFYNVPENGLDGRTGNAVPLVKAPTAEQQKRIDELQKQAEALEQRLASPQPQIDAAQQQWETVLGRQTAAVTWATLDPTAMASTGGATLQKDKDGSIKVTGTNPATDSYTLQVQPKLDQVTALRLEVLPDPSLKANGPGRSENGNVVLTEVRLQMASAPATVLKFGAATADFSQDTFPIANAIDQNPKSGWAIYPEVGKPHIAILELASPLKLPLETSLTVTLDFLSQFGQHQAGRFRLSVTDAANPHGSPQLPENIRQIVALEPTARTKDQQAALRTYYRANVSPEARKWQAELTALRDQRAAIDKVVPSAMVMQEMTPARETRLLIRGQYDKKGDMVSAAVPASLPQLPKDAPANRLGLAQWLVSPEHPLMSRVTVNRYWQLVFGSGLVKTSDDFGSQGDIPSHPELLDWLAAEFMQPTDPKTAARWDVKALLRLMVTSATYRQQSSVTRDLLTKDPENRLLARGTRHRLQVEFIRDQALFVSGLLDKRVGGASVSPYQPAGLWEELMARADGKNWTAQEYLQSHGPDLYRRTMYTFWKRTCPPPSLMTFDAPDRETCIVRRARTNTPLQALVLLNDPTYVEASRKLAERILLEGGTTTESRINFAFRTVLSRQPKPQEISVLKNIYTRQLEKFRQNETAAQKLLKVGEAPRNEQLDVAELATWATISSVLLNLDETVTKG